MNEKMFLGGLGNTLSILRQDKGFSQTALAEALGVSQYYISKLEQGRVAAPRLSVLAAAAEALGVPLWRLFFLAELRGRNLNANDPDVVNAELTRDWMD